MDKLTAVQKLTEDDVYDTRILTERTGDSETAQDDYALRRVPATWRWNAWSSLWAFSGISTALAYPLTAGLLSVFFGASAVIVAVLLTMVYVWIGVYYMSKKAAQEGAILELMSKHTFGFKGSSYQFVIFGVLGTVYFSLEAHVMSSALSESVSFISYDVAAAIVCVAFIPLTVYGMQFLSKFQSLTIWLYGIGILLAIYALFAGWSQEINSIVAGEHWWNVNPNNVPLTWVSVLSAFGAFSGLLGAILILLCTDTARFAKRNEGRKVGVLMSVVGCSGPILLATLFGIYLLAGSGGKIPDPGVSLVRLMGAFGLALILLTQIRVNVINVYFGTNALENFTSQALKLSWKRSAFVIPFMIIAYLILTSSFLDYFGILMTMLSVFLVNWANVLLGDLALVRGRHGIPKWSEFRRGYVAPYNKIGMISMWVPTVVGVAMGSGQFGQEVQALAVPLTGIAAFFMPVVLSHMMSRETLFKQYFARVPASTESLKTEYKCVSCSGIFHKSDFVSCPFHQDQFICSNCCATEKACATQCHTEVLVVNRESNASTVGAA
jgi:purine-cytosine permease-like protein